MGVSENSGTPKSSILIGISIINHPFWGYHYFWKHPYLQKDVLVTGERGFWSKNLSGSFLGSMG